MNEYTITRAHLADSLYSEFGIPYNESIKIVDSILTEIIDKVAKEKIVKIPNFGSFNLREKKERVGRNLKTKEFVKIKAQKVVSFYPSNILKEKVNK